jgi:hypothetical protein
MLESQLRIKDSENAKGMQVSSLKGSILVLKWALEEVAAEGEEVPDFEV